MPRPTPRPKPEGPLQRRSSAELAADAIRSRILRGDYAEGAPLRQDALAAELGISRIPVREALRQLEAEGLVAIHVHQGAIVPVLSLDEIEELFELRALIEGDLMRRSVPALTSAHLAEAAAALEAYDEALLAGDVAEWGHHNWAFHSALLAAARRPLALEFAGTLHNRSDRYMRMQLSLTRGQARAREEHHEIMRSVQDRDVRRAAALVREHVRSAGASLIDFLREHRSQSEPKEVK